jgi:LAO/AO transport system kinase
MEDQHHHHTALKVNDGIPQPPSVDEGSASRFINIKRKKLTSDELVSGILKGDRTILSKAITMVESSKPDHQATAQKVIENCLPHAGKSVRLGITGVPGAGKSTFIEAFGKWLTNNGHKVAVLAIDPSSERSKGSILGDKTRMEELSIDPNAFIRPSPSAGSLGGVARKTRETTILCEAAGFDIIIIETVGVGQSETAVHSMVDFFLLIQIAGAGDELQGIKRGIMEMADGIVINKADGSNIDRANLAAAEFRNALHLFPSSPSGWVPMVLTCSSREKTGIGEVWYMINDYCLMAQANDYFSGRRREQAKFWMYQTINNALLDNFYNQPNIDELLKVNEQLVLNDKISSFVAANNLLDTYLKGE